MGNYLAQPNCAKDSGSGASARVSYGVSSMQGWRVSMEDSHVVYHQFSEPSEDQVPDPRKLIQHTPIAGECRRLHLFGIFDGHGGSQVARFASHAMVDELSKSPQFHEGNFEIAFKVAYCNIDRLLRANNWAQTHSRFLGEVNDGRDHSHITKDGPNTHCMLSGARSCSLCGCSVPGDQTVIEDTDTTTDRTPVSLEEPPTTQPMQLRTVVTSVAEMNPNSNLVNSITHGIKHIWGHVWNATSRILMSSSPAASSSGRPLALKVSPATNPAMYTGCTAICALLVENMLYIANAGDSRAVLCRGGRAEVLSQDHKPHLPEERQRIYAAGGFVEYGRVNGNLNLSRALGDLIYKQDLGLAPEKQIVTGYPEVRRIELQPEDEFLVIGCDGIWEYFSSQDIIDFLRARLRRQDGLDVMSSSSSAAEYAPRPQEIRPVSEEEFGAEYSSAGVELSKVVEKLFEYLISPNPSLFEYGCDNMTAILIDLRPGASCACRCHSIQREVFANIFTQPRKASTSSTVEDAEDEGKHEKAMQAMLDLNS